MKQQIATYIPTECPWRDTLYWYDTIDSTNTKAKALAISGAPEGTVVIADHQTHGRGRMGRSFHSPGGMGIYLSVLLRPNCPPEKLMHLTCAAGVAACDAIEVTTGFRPGIKWINDLVAGQHKLGGILTELSVDTKTGLVSHAIVGIGINCTQMPEDFPEELRTIATSLKAYTGHDTNPAELAASVITALWKTCGLNLFNAKAILDRYRHDCITIGLPVSILHNGTAQSAVAIDLDSAGGLIVQYSDGTRKTISSGEVSVRGLYGYIE